MSRMQATTGHLTHSRLHQPRQQLTAVCESAESTIQLKSSSFDSSNLLSTSSANKVPGSCLIITLRPFIVQAFLGYAEARYVHNGSVEEPLQQPRQQHQLDRLHVQIAQPPPKHADEASQSAVCTLNLCIISASLLPYQSGREGAAGCVTSKSDNRQDRPSPA